MDMSMRTICQSMARRHLQSMKAFDATGASRKGIKGFGIVLVATTPMSKEILLPQIDRTLWDWRDAITMVLYWSYSSLTLRTKITHHLCPGRYLLAPSFLCREGTDTAVLGEEEDSKWVLLDLSFCVQRG